MFFFSIVSLVFLLPISNAQTSGLFAWDFNSTSGGSLPACRPLTITLQPVEGEMLGQAPFFMIAYALGALPQTSYIGDDPNNLTWTADFPPLTELLLNVVDSDGSSGGTPAQLYKVGSGDSDECVPQSVKAPAMDFTLSSNVTERLETCEPWGLAIKGGQPPYTISLLALDSPVTTNLTGGTTDSTLFTYINRALPGSTLLAGVSDSEGRWAYGSSLVETYGGSDVTCNDLGSDFSNIPQQNSASDNHNDNNDDSDDSVSATTDNGSSARQTALLAGILTPLCLLIALGIVAFLWWRRKRQMARTETSSFSAVFPFKPGSDPEHGNRSTMSERRTTYTNTTIVSSAQPLPSSQMSVSGHSSDYQGTSYENGDTSFMTSPISPITAPSIKRRLPMPNPPLGQQPQPQHSSPISESSETPFASPPTSSGSGKRRLPTPPAVPGPSGSGNEEDVFQHTDSGLPGVVSRESLPPPYMNYGASTSR